MLKIAVLTALVWSGLAEAATELIKCQGKSPAYSYNFSVMFNQSTRTVKSVVVAAVAKAPGRKVEYTQLDGNQVRLLPGQGEFGGIRLIFGAYPREDGPYLVIDTDDDGRAAIQFNGRGLFKFDPDRGGALRRATCTRESLSPREEKEFAGCLANFEACTAGLSVPKNLGDD